MNASKTDIMSSTSPLINLVQAIHLPSHKFILTTSPSATSPNRVVLHLFAHTPKSDGNGGSGSGSDSDAGVRSASGSTSGSGVGYGADGNRLPLIIVWQGEIKLKTPEVSTSHAAITVKCHLSCYNHSSMPSCYCVKAIRGTVLHHTDMASVIARSSCFGGRYQEWIPTRRYASHQYDTTQ